ncbi:MAG: hypothetical protein RLZZ227_2629, partial [Pseudomonadota bacterium]
MTEEIPSNAVLGGLFEKWRRRRFLIIGCMLLCLSAGVGFVLGLPSLYRSTTTILFGQDSISTSLVRENATNELELRLGLVTQAVLSRTQLQEVMDAFDLYAQMRVESPPEAVIRRFRQDVTIEQKATTQPQYGQNSTYSVSISYQAWNPELAAEVANDLAARFKAENERLQVEQAERTTEFLRDQLEDAKARFSAEEKRVNEFRNAHMGKLPEQQAINLGTLERLNSALRLQAEKEMQLLGRRNELLFGGNRENQANSSAGALTGTLRLARLERELAEMKQEYTPNYPGVVRLEQEVAQLKLELAAQGGGSQPVETRQTSSPAEIDLELAEVKKKEQSIQLAIDEMMSRLSDMPRIEQQLIHFAYEHDAAREAYLSLQKLYQEARLAESLGIQQNQQFRILEMAIPPDYATAPDTTKLLLMAFMLAVGVAGGAGLLAEHFDRSFHSSDALRRFTNI